MGTANVAIRTDGTAVIQTDGSAVNHHIDLNKGTYSTACIVCVHVSGAGVVVYLKCIEHVLISIGLY